MLAWFFDLFCCFYVRLLHLPLLLSSRLVQAQWYHQGVEPLGRQWQSGDVVGCLVDMAERTMMVTLNGELLFNDRGSELAAKDFDIRDGLDQFLTLYSVLQRLDTDH